MDWTTLAASALDKAGSAASFGKGVASGVGEGAVSMAEGLWSLGKGAVNVSSRLATDSAYRQAAAEQTRALANSAFEYGGKLIDDPATRAQAYEQVQALAGSLKQQFLEARAQAEHEGKLAEFYGRVAGRGGFEVATFVVPAAKLSALGKGEEAAALARAAAVAKGGKTLDAVQAGRAIEKCKAVSAAAKELEAANAARQTGGGAGVDAADAIYEAIRADTSDVSRIAENTGIKARNLQKVKDHVFYDEHLLDRYRDYGVPSEWSRFDSDLDMANSWMRLTNGTHTSVDLQLLRHEAAEAWFMRKNGPSYLDAHSAAQQRFPSPF